MRLLARHLRGNAVAYLAIFVALGGTSYAAIAIPNNSVGNKQLKKNAVDSKKVKNKALLAEDVKDGQAPAGAPGVDGLPGDRGPAGVQGAKGDQGDKGQPGDTGVQGSNLTPSQSVSNDPSPNTDILASETVLLTAPAVVTTASNTRLRAAANGVFVGDANSTMTCLLKLATDGGAAAQIGQTMLQTFPTFPFDAPGAAEAAPTVAAGSHVVTFVCSDNSSTANTGVEFARGDLRVTTAAVP